VKSYKGLSVRVFWYYILRSELDTALEKRERVRTVSRAETASGDVESQRCPTRC
jgi:hypothetical protein